MQKIFKLIRQGNLEEIKNILDKNPEEINSVAKQPPKKDDGQSLLQVAIKSDNLDIANLLLDYKADVNFMEAENCSNEWRMPVIQDAIMCAIMCSRWNTKINNFQDRKNEEYVAKEKADKAFALLKRMLELGADLTLKDSYGNTCLDRAILDAKKILPRYDYQEHKFLNDKVVTPQLKEDLHRIFNLLFEYGAKIDWIERTTGKTYKELYTEGPIAELLNNINVKTRCKLFDIFKKF